MPARAPLGSDKYLAKIEILISEPGPEGKGRYPEWRNRKVFQDILWIPTTRAKGQAP